MTDKNFTTAIIAEKSPAEVFDTLLNVRAWWSGLYGESFKGTSEKVGDEFSFLAGDGVHYTEQKLVEAVPHKKIAWLVTKANLSFVEKTDEWEGTKITFDITEENGKTNITFTHIGLVPEFECYESCATAWTQYIREKLMNLVN